MEGGGRNHHWHGASDRREKFLAYSKSRLRGIRAMVRAGLRAGLRALSLLVPSLLLRLS